MSDIIEGTWDQVQAAFLKRLMEKHSAQTRVRLTVEELPDHSNASPLHSPEEAEKWIADLRTWAASHAPLDHEADDSRDTIYNEVVRDPR
jgi:hypothetical protein